jgi:DNA-binding NarL/FixJ family response regulator
MIADEQLPDPTAIGAPRSRVLLAVATPLRALGLTAALRDVPGVRVAWACYGVEAALADARRVAPRVVLADLHLPGGGAQTV